MEDFMSRVLSTEQAKTAIQQIQAIINGGFTDQISQLDAQGRVLSDPNVWDGPLASQFRGSTWPETKAALDKARTELEQLRGQLNQISTNIFTAGGGN
ncbi:pyrophosphorylase [Paeniglutamicibacter sp. ZC-3]|nr:pyrophosphorylase [Paeniglutamicibacter sp. ZC-3]MCV9995292.1 pyrophosphorylase [Paeniglutamicibacter sp. ZC-3]